MNMSLTDKNIDNLLVIKSLVCNLESNVLTAKLPIIFGSSIGQHIRHIIEFYSCLLKDNEAKQVCYDKRERNILLETDSVFIASTIDQILEQLSQIKNNRELILQISFSQEEEEFESFPTSLYRELAYCLEHTIHHLSTIKIALLNQLPEFNLPENLGVAYATIRAAKKCAQ